MRQFKKIEDSVDGDKEYKNQTIYSMMSKTDEQLVKCLEAEDKIEDQLDGSINDEENCKKPILKRVFSKMEAGSLRGSIFAMSSLALGTGCLSLPLRFAQMSMACGLIVLILGSAAAYWSLIILIESSKKTKSLEYATLVKDTLGTKMAIILDIITSIFVFGVLISYQVISKFK
jgi:hypothetical protein